MNTDRSYLHSILRLPATAVGLLITRLTREHTLARAREENIRLDRELLRVQGDLDVWRKRAAYWERATEQVNQHLDRLNDHLDERGLSWTDALFRVRQLQDFFISMCRLPPPGRCVCIGGRRVDTCPVHGAATEGWGRAQRLLQEACRHLPPYRHGDALYVELGRVTMAVQGRDPDRARAYLLTAIGAAVRADLWYLPPGTEDGRGQDQRTPLGKALDELKAAIPAPAGEAINRPPGVRLVRATDLPTERSHPAAETLAYPGTEPAAADPWQQALTAWQAVCDILSGPGGAKYADPLLLAQDQVRAALQDRDTGRAVRLIDDAIACAERTGVWWDHFGNQTTDPTKGAGMTRKSPLARALLAAQDRVGALPPPPCGLCDQAQGHAETCPGIATEGPADPVPMLGDRCDTEVLQ